jgi:hypothetical protein
MYLAKCILKRRMFQTKVLENSATHFIFSTVFRGLTIVEVIKQRDCYAYILECICIFILIP